MSDATNTKVRVFLNHGKKIYTPIVIGEITVEWTRFASPGKMVLTVYKDDILQFEEGDVVKLRVNDNDYFFGFLFTYEIVAENQYKLTCYDALRYLKSKDVFKMKKQTYSAALKKVCKRYGLTKGTIANTRYVRKAKVFTGTVFDMLENYRKTTKKSTGNQFILFMDYNKVTLKKQDSMKTDWVIQASVAQKYSYSSSIDEDVYTVVKLYRKKGKKTKVYTKTLKSVKKKYGRLTYAENTKLKKKAKINKRLKKIAAAHDSPRKKLSFTGVFGIPGIRAGSGVKVKLSTDGLSLNKNMVVSRVTHRFQGGIHTMDLTVIGGDFHDG